MGQRFRLRAPAAPARTVCARGFRIRRLTSEPCVVRPQQPRIGGAEKHLIELLHPLSGCGVNLSVLCLNADFFTERLSGNGAFCLNIRRARTPGSLWEWVRILRDIRPDALVFVNGWFSNFRWYASSAAMSTVQWARLRM